MARPLPGLAEAPRRESISGRASVLWLVGIALVLLFTFTHNRQCLSAGLDGTWYRVMFGYEAVDRVPFTETGVDAVAGSFDAYYPLQREYMLPSAIALLLGEPQLDRGMTYFVYSLILVAAIYALGRAVGVERGVALTGAVIMAVLAPPGLANRPSQLYHLFQLNPHWFQTTGFAVLIVACFWALDGRGRWRTLALAAAPTLLFGLAILGVAPQVIFMVPPVAVYGAASLLAAERWRDDRWRLLAGVVMVGVPLLLGAGGFYLGLIQYTAYRFFPGEIEHPLAGAAGLSSLFGYWPLGRWMILLGLGGAAWTVALGEGKKRLLALAHLVATAAFLLIGGWFAFLARDYRGSFPVYFETGLWPYAALFAAVLLGVAARAALGIGNLLAGGRLDRLSRHGTALLLAGLLLAVTGFNAWVARRAPTDCSGWSTPPVRPTAITDYLEREIALTPGKPFRGMVATLDGIPPGQPADWVALAGTDHKLWEETGNDHRVAGLWKFNIPTLFQYQTFITPPYYVVVTDFLARPSDHQLRSSLVISQIDAPMMRLWGVRYLITDRPADIGTEVMQLATRSAGVLRITELDHVNLGDYSPTEVRRAEDFHAGLSIMHEPGFDGARQVVTDAALDGAGLVPATDARLIYEPDGFHLTAHSSGRSLLVLPAQYSHCWSIDAAAPATLFRADLMQLGVGFTGDLDARLVFRYGPILAGSCRLEDLGDMARLRVREARSAAWRGAAQP